LQTQGFHAYLIAAGQMGPKSVRDEELRTQLIQETAGLSQEQIQDQYPAEYTALLRT
jgi:hypothetical protein